MIWIPVDPPERAISGPLRWIPTLQSGSRAISAFFFGSEWNIVHIPHLNWFEAPGAAADLSLASLH